MFHYVFQGFISSHLPKVKDAAVVEGIKSWWEENAGKNSAAVLSEGKAVTLNVQTFTLKVTQLPTLEVKIFTTVFGR